MSARKVARREFLKTGSIAALGLSVVAPKSLFAAVSGDRWLRPLLSVGYAPAVPEAGKSVRLGAADAALNGDPAFISHGARVAIRSFSRGSRHADFDGGAAIEVIHPAIGYAPEKYPRFRAWSYTTEQNGMDSVGGAIGFTVPVTATQGLQFVIRGISGVPGQPGGQMPMALTLGTGYGAMKLQRGIYVVAFRESNGDAVSSWSAHSVSLKNGQFVVDTEAFSYAVLTIDYAQ